jgi:uncharacterized protein YyaL (SSP411 family)
MTEHTNHLAGETSPYLLQHAHNPVNWYPWNPEALDQARREDKPILLSIGYSACHWCHVMAHESFEDPETAALMNELFVNIKVDREERPDLDKIYQTAHHLIARRSGGWPLTMFLTLDQVPFFGGTYFPKESRYGLPSFKDLLRRVDEFYREHRAELTQHNQAVLQALQSTLPAAPQAQEKIGLGPAPLDQARHQLEQSFDRQHGGFGPAPKFPHPTSLELLLRRYAATALQGRPDARALEMARYTLTKMAQGGIYDQLGGGFCRYSVDERWIIPHFEKMLYDNGPLLALYGDTWQITRDPLFQKVAEETAGWVMREMQSPEGGYYSSLDADSEGEEGKFYVWSREEVQALLDDEEYRLFAKHFGLDRTANFEGHWHLYVPHDISWLARETSLSQEQVRQVVNRARAKLLAAREQRVPLGRDDKILTSWNALMIKGMSIAGRRFGREDWLDSAERALEFIRTHLWHDGRLLATYKNGRAHLPAYLDDYVFLIDALLEFSQARFREGSLELTLQLTETVLTYFEDPRDGGFFFTADDHEALILRPKLLADDATPAGNGIAAYVLGRLGHLLGETRYLDAAERVLKSAWQAITELPYAHGALLLALEEYLYPPQTILLRGSADTLQTWQRRCQQSYAPQRVTLAIPDSAQALPGLLDERKPIAQATAYVCSGHACSAPVTRFEDLDQALKDTELHPL